MTHQPTALEQIIRKWREKEARLAAFAEGVAVCADELERLLAALSAAPDAQGQEKEQEDLARVGGSKVTPRPRATASTD